MSLPSRRAMSYCTLFYGFMYQEKKKEIKSKQTGSSTLPHRLKEKRFHTHNIAAFHIFNSN